MDDIDAERPPEYSEIVLPESMAQHRQRELNRIASLGTGTPRFNPVTGEPVNLPAGARFDPFTGAPLPAASSAEAEHARHVRNRETSAEGCAGSQCLRCINVFPGVVALFLIATAVLVSESLTLKHADVGDHSISIGLWKIKGMDFILHEAGFPSGTCEAIHKLPLGSGSGGGQGASQTGVMTQTGYVQSLNCSINPNNSDRMNCINFCRQQLVVSFDATQGTYSMSSNQSSQMQPDGTICPCDMTAAGTQNGDGSVTFEFSDANTEYQITLSHDYTQNSLATDLLIQELPEAYVNLPQCDGDDYTVISGTILGDSAIPNDDDPSDPTGNDDLDDNDFDNDGDDDGDDDDEFGLQSTCKYSMYARCYAGRISGGCSIGAMALAVVCGLLWIGNARKRSRNLYIGFSFVGAGFAFLTVGVVLSFMLGTDHAEGALCGIPSDVKDLGIHYGPSFLMYVASAVLVSLSFLLVVCC
eukprot:m.1216121 g.1216121  ORF g.1216121 m.1216121 type:complete len:472 (+) comp24613_c0_seq11:221-1636(+)